MWKAALERCGSQIEDRFDLSGVCLLSEGHSAASIDQVLSALTTEHTLSPASPDILYDRRPSSSPFRRQESPKRTHKLLMLRDCADHTVMCSALL